MQIEATTTHLKASTSTPRIRRIIETSERSLPLEIKANTQGRIRFSWEFRWERILFLGQVRLLLINMHAIVVCWRPAFYMPIPSRAKFVCCFITHVQLHWRLFIWFDYFSRTPMDCQICNDGLGLTINWSLCQIRQFHSRLTDYLPTIL